MIDEVSFRNLFSQNIKKYRQVKGWSQERLAEKMEISTNYLSEIETGKGWVSPHSLVKLANSLEIEIFELFKPHEAAPPNVENMVKKYLCDFSTSLKVSLNKSIDDSLSNIYKNL